MPQQVEAFCRKSRKCRKAAAESGYKQQPCRIGNITPYCAAYDNSGNKASCNIYGHCSPGECPVRDFRNVFRCQIPHNGTCPATKGNQQNIFHVVYYRLKESGFPLNEELKEPLSYTTVPLITVVVTEHGNLCPSNGDHPHFERMFLRVTV